MFSAEDVSLPTLPQLTGYTPGGYNYCVAISPARNGKVVIASSGYYGDVKLGELDCPPSSSCTLDTTSRASIVTGDRRVDDIKFFPAPNPSEALRLARSLKDKVVIYEENAAMDDFNELVTLSHPGRWENFFDVSSDGTILVSGTDGNGGTVKTFNLTSASYDELVVVDGIGSVTSIVFSEDGNYIAAAGSDGWIKIYDPSNLDEIVSLNDAHAGRIYSVVFGPGTSPYTLISSGADGYINLWEFDANAGPVSGPSTTSPPPGPCVGEVDSKSAAFCQNKADSRCPPAGNTVQCDCTCCCTLNPSGAECQGNPLTCQVP